MMKAVLVALVALYAVAALASVDYALDQKIVEHVNSDPQSTWVAGPNDRFAGVTLQEASRLLGARRVPSRLPRKVHAPRAIPESFDARTQWPNCIHPIRDQAQCGSCWAFGATEALSDRLCIASQGKINVVLSPQELVSCDQSDEGCNGGYLDNAWSYMKNHGVPTDACYPYTSASGDAGTCQETCKDGSKPVYYHAKTTYDISSNVANIQTEIMTNGPVEVAFDVYQDFFNYKSGVYTHKSGSLAGGHAVKMIGWGTTGGVDYWIVANSWGTSWGQNGYFLIKRGSDECGIEDSVVAGLPDVSATARPGIHIAPVESLDAPVLDSRIIDHVNQDKQATWQAAHNDRFAGVSLKEARRLMGTKLDKLPKKAPIALHASHTPDSFDARTQWPGCIHPIRNQEQCGSCWAFGASEALSDRLCIATSGAINVVLSPENLVSCDTTDQGCGGGYLQNAWEFMASSGIVSDACFPYTAGDGDAAPCQSTCSDGSQWQPYYVEASSIQTYTDVASIQTAIMTNGPVEGAFTVYQDFMSYKSGVYTHKTGSMLGGHAIKILGWGTDNGQDYWLVANSWGTSWGEAGFFRIARGTDECGIEDNVVAGLPKV